MDTYDLCVIGSGPGGYVAAIRAAQLGLKTVCIEKEKTLGGTCLNVGCIPSKCMLQSTEYYHLAKHKLPEYGVSAKEVAFDFDAMKQRKEGVVKTLVDSIPAHFKKHEIVWEKGTATFVESNIVDVGGKKISAKYFIIATGSEPIELPFLKFDETTVVSSTGALSLKEVPKRMALIGGGVIGTEIASIYNRLGSEVHIIEMLDAILPGFDNTVVKEFTRILKKQGMNFHLSAKVKAGEKKANGVALTFEENGKDVQETFDVVLVAIGRKPYTKDLGLKTIGVETNEKGQVKVNGLFQTNLPHIYAIGDVIDGPMLAHKASEEGIAAVDIIAGQIPHVNYISIPNIVYTHPEVTFVGLTEQEARAAGREIVTGVCYFKANARARCVGDTDGLVKIIGDKKTDRLLGMHILGPCSSEMIGEGVVALNKKMTLEEICESSHGHPTFSEAILEATMAAKGRAIHI